MFSIISMFNPLTGVTNFIINAGFGLPGNFLGYFYKEQIFSVEELFSDPEKILD